MKILKVRATNFGSYDNFELDLSDTGLSLIYGETGSGKSTIMDMISWGLYGVTSKCGSSADDVKSWGNAQKDTTVDLQTEKLNIHRVRGKNSQHDLFFTAGGVVVRGKDMRDTQQLLDAVLSCSRDLFLSTAYFSEFNLPAQFFMAKAKDRREVFEKIAPLQFPNKLNERISDDKKDTKQTLRETQEGYIKVSGRIDQLKQSYHQGIRQADLWAKDRDRRRRDCTAKKEGFEKEKENRIAGLRQQITKYSLQGKQSPSRTIEEIQETIKYLEQQVCEECGQPTASDAIRSWEKEISDLNMLTLVQRQQEDTIKSLKTQLASEEASVNLWGDVLAREEAKENPFTSQTLEDALQLKTLESEASALNNTINGLERRLGALDQLSGLSGQLRGLLLGAAILECQNNVNKLLSDTFDSEFQVSFKATGDDLEVGITKNGYAASFTQLSKGQRRLLSLCFSVTIMEMAANAGGVHMDLLMLDEPCDGMDEKLKEKAYSLYQELTTKHSSVLIIEHSSSTQALFDKKYHVTMVDDRSSVCEE